MSDPSLELQLRGSAYWLRKSSDKTMKFAADLQDKAAARIRELEQQLADRDTAWKRAVWEACWMVWHMSFDDYNAEHGATEKEITEAVDYVVAVALHYLKSEGSES